MLTRARRRFGLCAIEGVRAWLMARSLPVHQVIGCLFLAGLFYAFQVGYNSIGAAGEGSALGSYLVWLVAANGLSYAPGEIEKDVQNGVIQHFYLSGTRLRDVVAVRSAIGIFHSIAVVILVGLLLWLFGAVKHFVAGPRACFAIADGTLIGLGLGFAASGLALLLRPIPILLLPVQLILMASAAVHTWPKQPAEMGLLLLPLAPASILLGPSQLTALRLSFVALHLLAYFAIGVLALAICENAARRRGTLIA